MINMNFFVTDTPMWYDPPFGPPIRISLSYNSQSAISHNEPFGNKWIFNYGGYLIMDTSGNVTIFMPDGRQDVYTPNGAGGYNPPLQVYNRLLQIAPNHFELHFPEGTVYVYQIPPGTTSQQPFLTEIDDAYGQKLTLGYNATVQLTTLTDAQGKVFTLSYNPVGLVTNVADPFGRNASFQYDGNNNLRQITDMGGYWSTFSYDANVFMTSIGDARGTTGFYTEVPGPSGANSDNYPPPGDPNMFQNYRITVTNALGYREEFMYYAGCDQDGYNGCAGYSWHVGPRDYIPWQSQSVNNYRSRAPKIRYIPTHVGSGQVGKLAEILNPLADYILYGYDTTTGNRISVTDAHGHVRRYTYNSLGLLTSLTDSQGTPISFIYSTNSVDLLSISNAVGQIAAAYNPQHDITSLSSRLTNTSTVAYNSYGQIAQRVNALGITNQYLYDINGRLSAITRSGYTMETFTYDALGRVKTFTDSSGLTITNDYNNLNHLTRRTYRDERSEIYTYSSCCPNLLDSYTDRAGRTTTYIYDAMKRLVQIMNPETGAIQFAYDPNGNLVQLTDPNNNRTTLTYDLDNRLTGQIFPDGKGITYTYDGAGLVKTRTNGRGIVATYGYDANHNITSRSYSDGTPAITNIYDTFNRVTNVLDVIGSNVYTYDADSRLIAADGPWPNDGITYAYDSINQLTNISAQGGQSFGYIFDALDRLSSLQRGAALYNFTYVGQSRMVQRLSRPNGSYSDYAYDDLERLTGVTNKQSSGQVISGFSYTYNSADQRDSETVSNSVFVGPSTNQVVVYSYNGLNQILTSAPPSQIFGYDADGNMTKGVLPGGSVFTAAYDAENRLASVIYTNAVGVTCSNQYFYGGRGLLSQTRSYTNGILANDTRFVRSGYLVIQERDSSNLTTRDYAWSLARPGGIGCLLGMVQAGNEYSYAFDGKGNVSAITDSAQGVAAAYSYDPFGLLLSSAGYLQQPYRFSTKAVDSNTGIIDFGYRRYLPGADRWMSRDPLADTTTLSLYTYVLNNPINRVDPYGLADDGNGNNPGFIDYPASFIGGPCCGPGYDCSNPNNPRRNDPSPGNQACLRHDVALHNSGAPWTDLTNPDVYNTHLNLGKEHPSPVFKVIFCTLGTVGKTTRSVEDSINDTWSKIWNDFNNFVGYPSGGDPFFQ
jgi:RHS repeat-associated protein